MKQTSIFDFKARLVKREFQLVDLTGEDSDENPFLDASSLEANNAVTYENFVKQENVTDLTSVDVKLPLPEAPKIDPLRDFLSGPSDLFVPEMSEDENVPQQDQSGQSFPGCPLTDSDLLRFYDSDPDVDDNIDQDIEYNYVSEHDIDLNYRSDDESDYGFKILDLPSQPVSSKGRKDISIDDLPHIELHDTSRTTCPVCRVFLGQLVEEFQKMHISQCVELQNSLDSGPAKKPRLSKPPSLPKQPLYRNKNSSTPSPTKTIKPPKSLTLNSRRNPIPDLKTLTFPINPGMLYSISMDAFNYAPLDIIDLYFLSHFHQDHYGGISKKWCYERLFECVDDFEDLSKYKPLIYCTDVTAKLLVLKFGIDPRFIQTLEINKKYMVRSYDALLDTMAQEVSHMNKKGLYVTLMSANHCPGSAIFLFESVGDDVPVTRYLHCGDFRVNKPMLQHEVLKPFLRPKATQTLDKVYLDTTYLTFHYDFPKQEKVCDETAQMFHELCKDDGENELLSSWFGLTKQSRITDFISNTLYKKKKKFLILVGTYVIGKERLAISILEKLNNCPIYILNIKSRDNQFDVVKTFGNDYLDKYVTENEIGNDTCECVIHLVPMGIIYKIEDLSHYFYDNKYFDYFERCVGLRPTGWSYTDTYLTSKDLSDLEHNSHVDDPLTANQFLNKLCDICLEDPPFSFIENLLPQNKKTRTTRNPERDVLRIYSLPYSEHSSYRELSFFCLFLKIREVIPTVNTELPASLEKMNRHISFWRKAVLLKKSKVKDLAIDPMVSDKLRSLTLGKF